MSARHVLGFVATIALSTLAALAACGVEVSIEGESSSGSSGTSSGTGGTSSGSSGTSSGTSGTSGTTDGGDEPFEKIAVGHTTAMAIGPTMALFAGPGGLFWCVKKNCTATAPVTNPPAGTPTAVAYANLEFYAVAGGVFHVCKAFDGPPSSMVCTGHPAATPELFDAVDLHADAKSVVWLEGGTVYHSIIGNPIVPNVVSTIGDGTLALENDTLLHSVTALGTVYRYYTVSEATDGGTPPRAIIANTTQQLSPPQGLVLAGDTFFIVSKGTANNGFVLGCRSDGDGCASSTNVRLATMLSEPWGLAADATNVYWTERGSGQVRRVAKSATGSTPPTLIGSGLGSPTAIAVDDTHVWALATAGGVVVPHRKRKPSP